MNMLNEGLKTKGESAKAATHVVSRLPDDIKNRVITQLAEALVDQQNDIVEANKIDYEAAKVNGLSEALLDRLLLTPQRLEGIAQNIRRIVALPDPVGEVFDMRTRPNGLKVAKKRVPIGVIGSIYESRPDVTVDIATLCIKSGNVCVLRGGHEAIYSNMALVKLIHTALIDNEVSVDAVQFVDNTDRTLVEEMLRMREYIDLMIPRGGANFIRFVAETATMPVVVGGIGVCHTYVDQSADVEKAVSIAFNAKVQRPSTCNALDSLLVHSDIARNYLPRIARIWTDAGVEMRCDQRALSILEDTKKLNTRPVEESDWGQEFLSLIASVKIVDSLDEAMNHIQQYGSGHSEAIVTEDQAAGVRFLDEVDAAVVYLNASTRFTDGGELGLGAEVGISTQKLHARGPMGLAEMTSYKWIVTGNGHVRD